MYSDSGSHDISHYRSTAHATILKRWETNVVFEGNPQIRLLIEVRPVDGAPFEAEVRTVVDRWVLPRLHPGATLQVVYNPDDRARVAILALPGPTV